VKLFAGWRLSWDRIPHPVSQTTPGAAVLALARDWLLAAGARIQRGPEDVVAARLPDDSTIAYTTNALRVRDREDAQLLAAIARDGIGLALRIPASIGNAAAIVRGAVSVLDERRHLPTPTNGVDHRLCVDCLEREGRLVVLGAGAGVRELRVERQEHRETVEAIVMLNVRTHRGLREEVVRLATDVATGAALAPLSLGHLCHAEEDVTLAASRRAATPALEAIEAAAARVAGAAGRLARLQSLEDYRRRQSDIAATQEHLLVEAPENGRAILAARQAELNRLGAAHSVTVGSRLLAMTTISEPVAVVCVGLSSGGVLPLRVDLARQTVEAPHCAICAQPWRIGARCAEGHITCLDCQQACVHCGKRQCGQCAVAPLVACPVCDAPACARCARDAARGRHRHDASAASWAYAIDAGAARSEPLSMGSASDLTSADLEAMTPDTWRDFVRWYLDALGYRVRVEVAVDDDALLSFECDAVDGVDAQDVLVVTPLRAACAGGDALLARRLAEQRKRRPGTRLVAVVRRAASHLSPALVGMPALTIVDREQLALFIGRQSEAFGHTQRQAESDTEVRARAAIDVQMTLRHALASAADALAAGAAAGGPANDTGAPASLESVEEQARLLRQVLLACETLAEDWTSIFGAAPTRANTLAIESDIAAIGQLGDRTTHLAATLRRAAGALAAPAGKASRAVQRWRGALCDEFAQQCRLLVSRCEAIDPAHWRDFDAAHSAGATDSIAAALAAWQRAGLRTRRLRDEVTAAMADRAPFPAPRA
jgi:hypothetical protein